MAEDKKKGEDVPLSCAICLKEIGHEAGETFEVDDYVHHFCGLDCYSQWQRKKTEEGSEKDEG
jgi:hypothetical protein